MIKISNNVKVWALSAIFGGLIAGALALITNLTGISFYKVVVIALLIMLLNKSGLVESNVQ